MRNEAKLKDNNRLRMMYATLGKMDNKKKATIIEDSKKFLDEL